MPSVVDRAVPAENGVCADEHRRGEEEGGKRRKKRGGKEVRLKQPNNDHFFIIN